MLRALHISNLAVIADAAIELDGGLNCFTGQTGAGKSLVIGALEVLLGLRQPQDMLRQNAREGRITGEFHIASRAVRTALSAATDLPLEEDPELILVRRIYDSGRSTASVNGNPVTGTMLKAAGEILVDVHGQHDAQYLLKPGNQLSILDTFGGAVETAAGYAELYQQRTALVRQREQLDASSTLRRQQLELAEFQAAELDAAALVAGEQEELSARHKLLSNMQKIKQQAGAAYGALYEDEGAVLERLKTVAMVLLELSELDENIAPTAQQVRDAALSLDDAAYNLRRYVDRLELSPAELAEVEQRLNLVNRLIDKYARRQGTVQDVLDFREKLEEELTALRKANEDSGAVSGQITDCEEKLAATGARLTALRRRAAGRLEELVGRQLSELGMKEARFSVEFTPATEGQYLPTGLETLEFLIAPNPGQPARQLRRIASGGELSRVMLGLKSILAQADRVSVLVFDEIDANVGGRMGSVIGEKLRDLARLHQVLCITHLPQIAAFAQRHVTVRKQSAAGESYTTVETLQGEARVEELAEMITGKHRTDTSLAQARELLEIAAEKPGRPAPAKNSPRSGATPPPSRAPRPAARSRSVTKK